MNTFAFAAAFATMAAAGAALASPITVSPGTLSANGDVKAVFVYADAGNTSTLDLVLGISDIFRNHPLNAEAASSIGDFADLGVKNGPITFQLNNVTQGYGFQTGVLDTVDGAYHAIYTTDFSTLGDGTISSAAQASINANLGPNAIFIAFEDKRFGDYDYNDLVFAFSSTQVVPIPEPMTAGLLGAGVLGLAAVRRKRV